MDDREREITFECNKHSCQILSRKGEFLQSDEGKILVVPWEFGLNLLHFQSATLFTIEQPPPVTLLPTKADIFGQYDAEISMKESLKGANK